MYKKVWFTLPAEYSPGVEGEGRPGSPSHSQGFVQLPAASPDVSSGSGQDLSQYSQLSEEDQSRLSQTEKDLYKLSQKKLAQPPQTRLSQLSQNHPSQLPQTDPSRISQKDLSQLSHTDLSQYSELSQDLSQYSCTSEQCTSKSFKTPARFFSYPKITGKGGINYSKLSKKDLSKYSHSPQDLSQYSAQSSMDPNSTTETYSTNDSQEVSSSQQDSTDGQYGFDEGNSTSSLQEEAVNSAIMEVSGELMLGKFSPHKHASVGSESSDISDDDLRRAASGGSIAKYPESSTGMSDNDWNPYATESDTNQTPRSPRSTTSEDNRVGFVSRATINIGGMPEKYKESTATVSMTTGEVVVGPSRRSGGQKSDEEYKPDPSSQRLDMLRYLVDKEANEVSPRGEEDRSSPRPGDTGLGELVRDIVDLVRDDDDRDSRDSPETVKSVHTEETLSARQSLESRKSDDGLGKSADSDSGTFGRPSGDFEPEDESRRQSGESGRSRQSVESWKSGASGRSEQSVDSHQSERSGQSEQSQRSQQSDNSDRDTGRSSDRSERLDRLSAATGSGITDVINFENAQRGKTDNKEAERREATKSPVTRMRLTAKLQPYNAPGLAKTTEDGPNLVGKTGYVSIAERERMLTDSQNTTQEDNYPSVPRLELERARPTHSNTNLPVFSQVDRSPSEVSMQRVSSLFEETKLAARAAVALPRPDPSGSEERFPLRDRMDHSIHETSLMAPENRASFERSEERTHTRPRDAEVGRSITSEEVARVLGKYNDDAGNTLRRQEPKYDEKSPISPSTYDRVDLTETENSYTNTSASSRGTSRGTTNSAASQRMDDVSDDEIARRVRAILAEKDRLGVSGGNGRTYPPPDGLGKVEYVPRTIDYTRLQRDLEEIQDSLQDAPPPLANDSLHALAKGRHDQPAKRDSPASDDYRSLETTGGTARGRESGASEAGGRLAWDHGADLRYDNEYDGKFLGTTSTETLSTRPRYATSSSDDMVVRPISSASNDTERDVPDLESTGTRTLTGADISRAEKLVQQVLNRQPEGDLRENVEDIIARYRNDRKDMYERLHTEPDPESLPRSAPPEIPGSLKKPELYMSGEPADDRRDTPGLAERVYKILTSTDNKENNDPEEKGMAKTVYNILSKDPPHQQVNGILTQTTAEENEILKKMVVRPKDDSSMDDSGLNGSGDSFALDDKDIRKQLEYSQFSSPDKTGMSDLASIRKVTSAPYSSVNNVKSLLSSQLQKVTQRNFDKSVEMRTPYRQTVDCYPVYGMELGAHRGGPAGGQREAWPEGERPQAEAAADRPAALSSERFFLTDKDQTPARSGPYRMAEAHHRTHSDPFDVTPGRRAADDLRDGHARSKSEEAADLGDLSQYSFQDLPTSPAHNPHSDNPAALTSNGLVTPKLHRSQDWGYECYTSDSSGPHCHSDSSDGNMAHHHGYHMYANTRVNPFIDRDNSAHPKTKHLVVQTTNLSITTSEEGDESPCCGNDQLDPDPAKKPRSEGRSRPGLRYRSPPYRKHRSQVSESQPSGTKSRSLPPEKRVTPFIGAELQSPISRDDVYELLCRSQLQEEKLHELRSRLLQRELQQTDILGQSGSVGRNHGDAGMRSNVTRSLGVHQPDGLGNSRRDGSPTESDTSRSRKGQLRPYRPLGSRDMYYTESGDDTNESGTTIESTHPGSDDAIPPYIPRQFLGSRQEEPMRHSTGIYGRKDKDDLSTIDEQSAKDEKEKALSLSTGSNKSNSCNAAPGDARSGRKSPSASSNPDSGIGTTTTSLPHDSRDTLRSDPGTSSTRSRPQYNSNPGSLPARSRSPYESNPRDLPARSRTPSNPGSSSQVTRSRSPASESTRSKSPYSQPAPRDNPARVAAVGISREPVDLHPVPLERPGFKTREEFQREFEARERSLQEELARHRQRDNKDGDQDRDRDPLGASVRSDPGGALEEAGSRWEYRESTDGQTFRQLEPEPVYPQERLRHSRSRSEADLAALSPTDSQKYSSPMLPGTRFLELSTQPSPIFSHQDSMTLGQGVSRGRGVGGAAEPEELPRVRPDTRELPRVDDRARTPPQVTPTQDLESAPVPLPVNPRQPLEPVELGADPRRIPAGMRRSPTDRPKSPLYSRQEVMEKELEKLNKDLTEQVNEIQEAPAETGEDFLDRFPPSKKAQVLREVLEQEYQDNIPPNINDMWARYKTQKEQSMSESSLNSTRLDALSGLLDNPTKHSVNSGVKDRSRGKEAGDKSRSRDGDGRSQGREESEKARDGRAGQGGGLSEDERRAVEVLAVEARSQRRQELRQRSGLSEEESNGSYTELIAEQERNKGADRGARRGAAAGRREERRAGTNKENRSPDKALGKAGRSGDKNRPTDKAVVTDIRANNYIVNTQHSDTMDTLFSIPEDASFEQSPTKAESEMKSRQKRHRHVIDPLMKKLRDKIKVQRVKIDRERRKELARMEKLRKLQLLLDAKQGGQLSDKAITVELGEVSTTSSCTSMTDGSLPGSDASHALSDTTLTAPSTAGESEDSTLRESTLDSIKLQTKKYPQDDFSRPRKAAVYSDSTDTSDFSNIIVERIVEGRAAKPEKKSSSKKKEGKTKKGRVGEDGKRIKKERKKKEKVVFGVDMSEEDLVRQLRQYERHRSPDGRRAYSAKSPERRQQQQQQHTSPERRRQMPRASSPERRRHVQDVGTMYPSPIVVSPPARRRMRDVLMRSEAIQTSPSIRSHSPTHSYDEVPVAPVPLMSSRTKSSRRRPSPSPPRPAPILQRKSSRSPQPKQTTPRQYSRSPPRGKMSRSSSDKSRRAVTAPMVRKARDESMWKVETELPPANSMFTPESPSCSAMVQEKPGDAWFIPMKASKPWQKSAKERQAFAVRQQAWEPKSVSQSTWKKIVSGDFGKDKEDLNDISRDTKFDLDPEGQPIRDGKEQSDSDEADDEDGKPFSKMSLQEAFAARKALAISKSRERQKRLALAAEERRMQHFLQQEREKLFQEERRKEANPDAHPYSDHLHKPARRVITKEEAKESSLKKYKKLPEVVRQEELKKRSEDYTLNRLKARLFNRRIQKKVLQKAEKWGR